MIILKVAAILFAFLGIVKPMFAGEVRPYYGSSQKVGDRH